MTVLAILLLLAALGGAALLGALAMAGQRWVLPSSAPWCAAS